MLPAEREDGVVTNSVEKVRSSLPWTKFCARQKVSLTFSG